MAQRSQGRPANAQEDRRRLMDHLSARGVPDPAVLEAIGAVPREAFIDPSLAEAAYDNTPLPIGGGQTISQPQMVATMIAALRPRPSDRVLEVGTGSGYSAAVLAHVVGQVYSVERDARLAGAAADRLCRLGHGNITVRHGDGAQGWPEHAPYDGIVVTAAAPQLPRRLCDQLVVGGRLVVPIGRSDAGQTLWLVHRVEEGYRHEDLGGVRFVPLR